MKTYDDLSRVVSAANGAGTVGFTYDNRGRLKTETDVYGHVLEYAYDAAGNRTELKLDSTVQSAYVYDAANRLTTLTDDASQNFTYGYDIADRLISKALPNGVTTTYEYDGMSRLKRLKDATTSTTLFDRQYTYNNANQITQITEPSQTRNFTYDNIDRLTGMTNGTSSESYSYDAVGNRTSSHLSSTYTINPFNRLAATASSSMSYDSNGNMTGKTVGAVSWTYAWDFENRMTSASDGVDTVSYVYDALGRRVKRTNGTDITKFTHDGDDVVLDDVSGTLAKYQNGLGIDNKLSVNNGSGYSYFLADHLGSTNGLVDQSGAVSSSTPYDSFGNQTGTVATRYGFTGRERDDSSGLMYYRARMYDPQIGRFISEDPVGFSGGDVNLYAYVMNSPIRLRDPFGLDPEYDEQRWRAQQDLINALASPIRYGTGFGDNVTVGISGAIRRWQGIDDPTVYCSVEYQAGWWSGMAVQVASGGIGLYRGGLAIASILGARWAATNGIAYAVRVGAAGERAVGIVGPKTAIQVAGRTRIPDRITLTTLEEVKNVKHLNFTRQLRDYYQYSQDNGLRMILHTRSGTTFSGPLQKAIDAGEIVVQIIPGM